MLASDSVTLRIDTSNVHQEVVISMVNNGDNIVQDVMQQQEGCDYAVLIRKTEFSKATMMLTKSRAGTNTSQATIASSTTIHVE